MKITMVLLLILSIAFISCLTLKKPIKDIENYESYQYHGTFDTCLTIEGGFLHGKNTLIFTKNDTISIWGKKCEFSKGDSIYSYGEIWNSPRGPFCKYFIIDKDKTLKYSIF